MRSAKQPRPLTADELDFVSETEANPNFFGQYVLGRDRWEVQKQIADDLTVPRARIAVKGANATGKTNLSADTVLWWTIHGGITITTAPTFRQVTKTMWPAIRTAHTKARYPLGGKLLNTELQIAPDIFALGMSTDAGVNALGFHGRILVVIDEAPGIGTGIFDAVRGIRAGGDVRILMLGNPDVEGGPYSEAFTAVGSGYRCYTISAFDTPNLTTLKKRPEEPWQETLKTLLELSPDALEDNVRPYLATRHWVKEMYDECGVDSPLWESRVLAQFPSQSQYAAYPLAWLEAAKKRTIEVPADADWQAGIDVAEAGEDETVLTVRHGPMIQPGFPISWSKNPETIQGEMIEALKPFRGKDIIVAYDAIGVGAYFATPLKQAGFRCVPIKVSESPTDKENFPLLRDEMSWALRDRMKPDADGMAQFGGLVDEKAFRQLANIRYAPDSQGRRKFESKESLRRRGAKSPDRAESIMLAFSARARANLQSQIFVGRVRR